MSRDCFDISRYIDMSSHCLDTSRHCLDMQTHLDMSKHIINCLDTLMIALENGLERKKIIYFLYNGLERYLSVCN